MSRHAFARGAASDRDRLHDGEDVGYVGDAALLQRLVLNLVDNAVKYTWEGARVTVDLTSNSTGVMLTVSNPGPGIPADARPFIFDRFFRVDQARTHSAVTTGSGLGLSIARWIAELHGGRLQLAEASADRTVFTLELPLNPLLSAAN